MLQSPPTALARLPAKVNRPGAIRFLPHRLFSIAWKSVPSDQTLGMVNFSIFPHLDHAMLPENTLADAERWAADIAGPAYAIDDETALMVVDGAVAVVSEGHWKQYG
jgi:hypothetical protein